MVAQHEGTAPNTVPHWLRMDAMDRWHSRQMFVQGNLRGVAQHERERLHRLGYEMRAAKVERIDRDLLVQALTETAPPSPEQVAAHHAEHIARAERAAADLAREHGRAEGRARTRLVEELQAAERALAHAQRETASRQAEARSFWERWARVAEGRPEPLNISAEVVGRVAEAAGSVDLAGQALARLLSEPAPSFRRIDTKGREVEVKDVLKGSALMAFGLAFMLLEGTLQTTEGVALLFGLGLTVGGSIVLGTA